MDVKLEIMLLVTYLKLHKLLPRISWTLLSFITKDVAINLLQIHIKIFKFYCNQNRVMAAREYRTHVDLILVLNSVEIYVSCVYRRQKKGINDVSEIWKNWSRNW